MENNLFKKLMNKLTLNDIRIKSAIKHIRNGLCIALISSTILLSTGCQNQTNNNDNNNNNENTHETGNSNNSNNNNENNNNENNNNQTENNPEYSEILNNVLNSEYYNFKILQTQSLDASKNYQYRDSNTFKPIPYGFLEDEGYNTDKIKNNQLKCESDVFTLGGELYIACKVENKADINYFTHYLVKYQLTEQELKDLKLTHKEISDGSNISRTVSFQAPFFIQELSYCKDATLISKAHTTKEIENEVESEINSNRYKGLHLQNYGYYNYVNTLLLNLSVEDEYSVSVSYLLFNDCLNSTPVIKSQTVSEIIFSISTNNGTSQFENDDYIFANIIPSYIPNKFADSVANTAKTATFYNSAHSTFVDMKNPKYENYFSLN